jgi:hypothetical protein
MLITLPLTVDTAYWLEAEGRCKKRKSRLPNNALEAECAKFDGNGHINGASIDVDDGDDALSISYTLNREKRTVF